MSAIPQTYDDVGNALSKTYPDGEVVTNGYTAQGWLGSLSMRQGTTTTLAQAGALLTTAARTLAAAGVLAGVLLAGQHSLTASSPSTASSAQAAPVHAETIHTTANHPWLTADRGWVAAGDLHAGEGIVTLDGAAATVAWVRTVPGQADRYNLTVASDHTYAVGASRAVVHNTCIGDSLPDFKPGGKTTGYFARSDGTPPQELLSGHSDENMFLQPRRLLPDNIPGMPRNVWNWDHVEAHAASLMRIEGLSEADLWINNPSGPCFKGVINCARNLPHMLPEGATLRVHYPGGEGAAWLEQTYIGLSDDQWVPPGGP